MDLTTLDALQLDLPSRPGAAWRPGDAWLAGGTWLFSEPQPQTSRLLDLTTLGWPALELHGSGLTIAATCTVAELYRFAGALPEGWTAAPLIRGCCESFVASFKIWNVATVGGNLCNALPAGPMTSLLAGLDGICTIWTPGGSEYELPVVDLVVGDNRHALAPGELVRSVRLGLSALTARVAMRQAALSTYGRSAALLVGRVTAGGGLVLTVTASVKRPVRLEFSGMPDAAEVSRSIDEAVPAELYHDDIHGHPLWRRHLTYRLAEEIRAELGSAGGVSG